VTENQEKERSHEILRNTESKPEGPISGEIKETEKISGVELVLPNEGGSGNKPNAGSNALLKH
jgi:hypothetical protein